MLSSDAVHFWGSHAVRSKRRGLPVIALEAAVLRERERKVVLGSA